MRIHYNVTGNERKALVKVIETTTGAKAVYMKMPTCAYEIDYFTVTKEGVLEFSDRSDSEEVEAVLEALAAAGFEGVGETVEEPEDALDVKIRFWNLPPSDEVLDSMPMTDSTELQ